MTFSGTSIDQSAVTPGWCGLADANSFVTAQSCANLCKCCIGGAQPPIDDCGDTPSLSSESVSVDHAATAIAATVAPDVVPPPNHSVGPDVVASAAAAGSISGQLQSECSFPYYLSLHMHESRSGKENPGFIFEKKRLRQRSQMCRASEMWGSIF